MLMESRSRLVELPRAGLVDMAALGPCIFSEFPVRRLRDARVLWLNERWFLEAGIQVTDPLTETEVCRILCDTYGVTTTDNVRVGATHGPSFNFGADRYGGTGGAAHGGSGRCGANGFYNAKGIGRTPLTPEHIPWSHAHGFLSMPEAIREIINAEVAAAELPHGAVPIIALIDTGLSFRPDPNGPAERRVIAIRPNFIRPAHFERSIYFGFGGKPSSDQFLDAQRVKQAVRLAVEQPRAVGMSDGGLEQMLMDIAEQIGASRAHRLWQGLLVTSNLSTDGGFVDFGAFRALPDWRRCHGGSGEVFGDEMRPFGAAIDSLVYYFRKYAPEYVPPNFAKRLKANAEAAMDRAFRAVALRGAGWSERVDARVTDELSGALWEYYCRQQRQRSTIESRQGSRSWLSDVIDGVGAEDSGPARAIGELFSKATRNGLNVATARMWLKPRPGLYYSVAHRDIIENANWLSGNERRDRKNLSLFIGQRVLASRRFWLRKPAQFAIKKGWADLSSVILLGEEGTKAWIDAPALDSMALIGGKPVSFSAFEDMNLNGGNRVSGLIGLGRADLELGEIRLGGEAIELAKMPLFL